MTTPKFREKTEKFYYFDTLFDKWVENWGQKGIYITKFGSKITFLG